MIRNIGDKVSIDHPKYPGVWVVESVGPVNTVVVSEDAARRMRVPHTMLLNPGATPPVNPTVIYNPGELVRITSGKWAGLWVVIADKGGDKVNLAKLGGDGGRYLRAMRHGLVKVDPSAVIS
jgi:hypothetical protein